MIRCFWWKITKNWRSFIKYDA